MYLAPAPHLEGIPPAREFGSSVYIYDSARLELNNKVDLNSPIFLYSSLKRSEFNSIIQMRTCCDLICSLSSICAIWPFIVETCSDKSSIFDFDFNSIFYNTDFYLVIIKQATVVMEQLNLAKQKAGFWLSSVF